MTALDPGDLAYNDEQEHMDRSGPAVPDGLMPDGSQPEGCPHPPQDRRLDDGEQICLLCGEPVAGPLQAIIPRDRAGAEDPTRREGDERSGGLRHVEYNPAQIGGDRPYTPDQVEREIVDTLDRIERGAGWLTTKEEERAAAKLAYELAYARSMLGATGRSESMRQAEALNANREQYADWQNLELVCRTAREGMHNLRSKLSGLQSVAKSISAALGAYR
jgi:hypothetical protein